MSRFLFFRFSNLFKRKRRVTALETWQIVDYLRSNRNYHVLINFNREMYRTEFGFVFSDEEWRDFLFFCDGVDNKFMFKRTDDYLALWKQHREMGG